MAHLRVHGPLKQLADGRADHILDGATVGELVRDLELKHPALRGWILDERGLVRAHINVFVNGDRSRDGTAVSPEDRVEVLPAISGGGAR